MMVSSVNALRSFGELFIEVESKDVDIGWLPEEEIALFDHTLSDEITPEEWPYLANLAPNARDVALHGAHRSLLSKGLLEVDDYSARPLNEYALIVATRSHPEALALLACNDPYVRVWIHRMDGNCFLQEYVSSSGYRNLRFCSLARQKNSINQFFEGKSDFASGETNSSSEWILRSRNCVDLERSEKQITVTRRSKIISVKRDHCEKPTYVELDNVEDEIETLLLI